jgi:Big-like domain-containing protein
MPVSGTTTENGTFSFNVLPQLQAALSDDRHVFAIQGRVNESTTGTERGLQVYTSVGANVSAHLEPQLALATPGVTPPLLTFSIQTLPAHGTLHTSGGTLIADAPFTLTDAIVLYTPAAGFVGDDTFDFQAEDFLAHTAIATVFVRVLAGDDPCTQNGREPGCQP